MTLNMSDAPKVAISLHTCSGFLLEKGGWPTHSGRYKTLDVRLPVSNCAPGNFKISRRPLMIDRSLALLEHLVNGGERVPGIFGLSRVLLARTVDVFKQDNRSEEKESNRVLWIARHAVGFSEVFARGVALHDLIW